VNTWWYAASSSTALGKYAVKRAPQQPTGISGPISLCQSSTGIYSVIPNPLPGALPNGYEWILTDVATGNTLFDSLGKGATLTISFSSFPPGNKYLKVRGSDVTCGLGSFGPGNTGILLNSTTSPQITNAVKTFTICTGSQTNILLQSNNPASTYTYTATSTSPFITGFSGGTANPIQQTLLNTGTEVDSVIYKVVPFATPCSGDTTKFYVVVNPLPIVNNPVTEFSICSGSAVNIPLISIPAGALFTWTVSSASPGLLGYTGQTIPTSAFVQTIINPGYSNGTVTYSIVAHLNGCSGPEKVFTITLKPNPDIYFSPAKDTICSGAQTNVQNLSHVTGTTFSWTVSTIAPQITGFGPGAESVIQQTLFNASNNPGDVDYLVTPSSNGCSGTAGHLFIRVNPQPFISFTPCFDTMTTTQSKAIKLKGGIPYGGNYSGAGVNSTTGILTPATAGVGDHSITYTYTYADLCVTSAASRVHIYSTPLFTCGNNLTDIRDNKSYPTVQIGTQCWMSADLNYGIEIPSTQYQRDNCFSEVYHNPAASSQKPVYQWDEIMRYDDTPGLQGLCPPGWHVPTEAEWNTLFSFYISNGFAGSPLKYSGFSGFNALLSGVNHFNRQWDFNNFATFFWSSTPYGPYKAWAHGMNDYNPSVSFYPSSRANAFSVRCIFD
jgi:uncharacterized protein (TIGR02145 family)